MSLKERLKLEELEGESLLPQKPKVDIKEKGLEQVDELEEMATEKSQPKKLN